MSQKQAAALTSWTYWGYVKCTGNSSYSSNNKLKIWKADPYLMKQWLAKYD